MCLVTVVTFPAIGRHRWPVATELDGTEQGTPTAAARNFIRHPRQEGGRVNSTFNLIRVECQTIWPAGLFLVLRIDEARSSRLLTLTWIHEHLSPHAQAEHGG